MSGRAAVRSTAPASRTVPGTRVAGPTKTTRATPARPELRLVPGATAVRPRRRVAEEPASRRAPFVLLVVALLVGTTLALLILNTAIAVDSLKATELRAGNADRAEQVQRLQQQVVSGGAPARIAEEAAAAGLVPAGPAAFLVIGPDGSSTLRGTPEPAEAPPAPLGAPSTPGGLSSSGTRGSGPGSGGRNRGRRLSVSTSARGPGAGPRSAGRGADSPFASRRVPGTRRSGAGLSLDQRGLRNRWGLIVMVTLLVLIVGRLAVVQGVDGAAYANAAEQDRLRTYPVAALRGQVLDRNGNPFAYTVDASRVVADPLVIRDADETAAALTGLLDVPAPQLAEKLTQDSRYVVLASQVPPETVDAIEALELSGVLFEDDPVRLYPAGSVGGQVVGFVGREGTGLAGIEQTFDDVLAGTPGERRVEVGSGGNRIPSGIDESSPATDGSTVTLTVDQDLQYVTEQRLGEACADGDTTQASAVVLDVTTGQVVAMGSCPGFDPGAYSTTDPALLGNPVVSDVFEPGSVMKAVTLSAALEEGVAEPDTVLTVDDKIDAGDRMVRDSHGHDPIDYTVTGILAKSSNVGTIMLAREVGTEKLEHYLRAFGLGSTSGIELPGESAGILQASADWSESRAANVPIGQGVSLTTLQMASIYQTIANAGVRIEPRIVESVTGPDGRVRPAPEPERTRVISESTAADMAYMLEAVVGEGGTAPRGAIEGFRVAGKTGTAQRPNPECNCYSGGGYVTTFVGFAPADDPQYVVAVDLERPTGGGEGGGVAAPVFADVMRYALTAHGIVPSGTSRPEFVLTGTP